MNNENNRNAFKMTEIGWLPEEWEVVKLGDVSDLIMGQSPPGDTYNTAGQGMPFLQGKAEFTEISPRHIKYTTKPLKIAAMKSILISVRAPVGDVNISDRDYCIGRGLASISLKEGSNNFLFYILKFYKKSLENEGYGSTFKAINRTKLENFKIPLPSLSEQKKIAAVLSAVQEAREKTEAVIAAAKELKKSLMKYLFTYGPVPVTEADQVRLKETEIGVMPEEWGVAPIHKIGRIITGTTPRTNLREYYDGPYMFIAPGDIGNKVYVENTEKYLTEKGLRVSRPLPKNSVLVVCIGATIGKVALTKIDNCTTNQQINSIIVSERNDPKFIYYSLSLRAPFLPLLAGRAAVPIVNKSNFAQFKISLPNYCIQKKISEILFFLDQKIESEQSKKQALDQLFKSLLHNLMTGKIRVNHLEL